MPARPNCLSVVPLSLSVTVCVCVCVLTLIHFNLLMQIVRKLFTFWHMQPAEEGSNILAITHQQDQVVWLLLLLLLLRLFTYANESNDSTNPFLLLPAIMKLGKWQSKRRANVTDRRARVKCHSGGENHGEGSVWKRERVREGERDQEKER